MQDCLDCWPHVFGLERTFRTKDRQQDAHAVISRREINLIWIAVGAAATFRFSPGNYHRPGRTISPSVNEVRQAIAREDEDVHSRLRARTEGRMTAVCADR